MCGVVFDETRTLKTNSIKKKYNMAGLFSKVADYPMLTGLSNTQRLVLGFGTLLLIVRITSK